MKKNNYLALRIILSIGIMAAVFYLTILSFINPNNAYMLTAIKDYTFIMSIAFIILFAELDKDKAQEERRKAFKEGYEQGKFDKEMEVTSDVEEV